MGSELIYGGHDGLSLAESDGYTSKPEKRLLWLLRPLRYLLREQRLLFMLVGVALATLVFAFAPASSSPSPSAAGASHVKLADHAAWRSSVAHHRAAFLLATVGHLVDRLMARGDSVIVVDNFFTGRKENVMHHFGNHPNFELIRHDVVEPLLLEVDQIYHLACPASPVHYKYNPP
ncbi:hypothetical protein BHE74_00030810 [Ensete ventricosum]|nr:hypothetical protein BHE74_00030810 [Ensete ventricosum]